MNHKRKPPMGSTRSKARKPTHPGEILREDVLPELEITQGDLAEKLGVSRRTVSEILHARRPVTPDMAIRIGRFCGNGPEVWMRMQAALDLWELERSNAASYRRIAAYRKAA
jgi:addiction module HigA family antidote